MEQLPTPALHRYFHKSHLNKIGVRKRKLRGVKQFSEVTQLARDGDGTLTHVCWALKPLVHLPHYMPKLKREFRDLQVSGFNLV